MARAAAPDDLGLRRDRDLAEDAVIHLALFEPHQPVRLEHDEALLGHAQRDAALPVCTKSSRGDLRKFASCASPRHPRGEKGAAARWRLLGARTPSFWGEKAWGRRRVTHARGFLSAVPGGSLAVIRRCQNSVRRPFLC